MKSSLQALDTPMPYEELENTGPLLVFLHGFPNNHCLFRPQVESFKDYFHILNFNLPGSYCGHVTDRKFFRTHYIQDTIIEVLKDRIKKHNKKVILVGHDLGCFILDEVGSQMSAHILGQVLISGMSLKLYTLKIKTPSQLLKSWYVALLQLPGAPLIVKKFLQKRMRKEAYSISHIRDDSPLYSEAPHGFAPVYLYQELGKKAVHVKKALDKSTIPTMFIFGDDDRFLNSPLQQEVDELYQHARIEILPGGHWISREKILEVNKLLADFFEEVCATGRAG